MIRRGSLKYIHCDPDPPQLYGLADDPNYAEAARAFATEVSERWNSGKLRQNIIVRKNHDGRCTPQWKPEQANIGITIHHPSPQKNMSAITWTGQKQPG